MGEEFQKERDIFMRTFFFFKDFIVDFSEFFSCCCASTKDIDTFENYTYHYP